MKNLIVPFEEDALCMKAAKMAVQFAKKMNATITLLYVIPHPTDDSFHTMAAGDYLDQEHNLFIKKLIERTEARMNAFEKKHSDITFVKHIRIGNSMDEITRIIEEEKGELLVMGTHETKGTSSGILPTETDHIINHAIAPTLVVSRDSESQLEGEFVFATDFNDLNQDFMVRLKGFLEMLGLNLTLLFINTPSDFVTTDEIESKYAEFCSKHDLPQHKFVVYNDKDTTEAIYKYTEKNQTAVIAVGSHRRVGIRRIFKRNTAEELIRHMDVPVWSWKLDG